MGQRTWPRSRPPGSACWRAGLSSRRASDPSAVAELERAELEFGECGANHFQDQVGTELRRLGRRSRRRTSSDAGGTATLTDREQEVARHVCDGRTNREIARLCYLSEKTVERHLSHIFIKLGVTSRAGVAGAVARDVDQHRQGEEE